MLAVAIPIAIHLFNVQQGKILKVGSVALLTKNAVTTTSRIKLHQLLLLLLRCLFIILLALMLAQPRWQGNSKQQGWVLLDKNNAQQTYTHYKQQVDSLLQAGCQLHYFNTGFATADVQQLSDTTKDSSVTNYWSTLLQLQHTAGTQVPLYIFTNAYVKNIAGNKPAATLNVHWYTYQPGDTATYNAGGYALQGYDSTMVVTAHTAAGATYNTYKPVKKAFAGEAKFDTSTWYISIYTKTYMADAAYIKAAVDAIKQVSNRKIVVTVTANALQLPRHNDWLFWLSVDTIPNNVTSQNIFKYVEGKTENVQSWVRPGGNATENIKPVALHKHIADTGYWYSKIIWTDGYGNALLAETNPGVYQFFSRFDASWNDLPFSSCFPQVMYSLMFADGDASLNTSDKRVVDDKQLQPHTAPGNTTMQTAKAGVDASPLFWLLAFIMFFMERIIALSAKKERAYV